MCVFRSHAPAAPAAAPQAEGDATTRSVIHDTIALLGMDRDICSDGDASRFLRVC